MPVMERDLIRPEVVDLSTLNGAELPALAAMSALEQKALSVFDQAAPYYGLGAYPGKDHTLAVIELLLATIDKLERHIRGE